MNSNDWSQQFTSFLTSGSFAQPGEPTTSTGGYFFDPTATAPEGGQEPGSITDGYQLFYDQLPAACCVVRADGCIAQVNKQACTLLGLTPARLVGRPFLQLIEPTKRLAFASGFSRLLRTQEPVSGEETLLLADGSPRRVHFKAVGRTRPDGQLLCHLVLLDVTQAYHESQALAASERKFRQLFEQSTDAAALMQHERFIDCNEAVLTLLGATRKDQIIGHYPWDMAPPEQRPGVSSEQYFRNSVAAALQLGSKRCEGILCRVTGQCMWVEAVLTPLTDGAEPLLHVVWRDITAQKQEERRLRECEERLRLLQTATGAGQWSWELTSNKFVGDARTLAYLGWEAAPAPSFDAFLTALHPDDVPAVKAALAGAQEQGEWPQQSFRVLWPDGSVHAVTANGWLSHDAFGEPQRLLGVLQPAPQ
ncbi:PAS domain S-box protein [Hymenobacter sp. CRA2]|uniref:PAS domain-containing protein n=1 Tax=Hymenobacter sp. CRA2 TaxID=1955620 RepID=UPI0011175162|nr:PAS domain S-box protein [Hymenobacter sp. CRA2]